MSILFSRRAVIPVWFIGIFGLIALFGPPMTSATILPLLLFGVVPPVILLFLFKAPSRSVAEMVRDIEKPRTE